METFGLGVVLFTVIVLILVGIILSARSKLVSSGAQDDAHQDQNDHGKQDNAKTEGFHIDWPFLQSYAAERHEG
ncbi:MAG: hypothetical protein AAF825_06940, partial [Pseudomonadota bacterium]